MVFLKKKFCDTTYSISRIKKYLSTYTRKYVLIKIFMKCKNDLIVLKNVCCRQH